MIVIVFWSHRLDAVNNLVYFRNTEMLRTVVMVGTMGQFFFKPEKNLEFFRQKKLAHRCHPW